MFISLTVKKNTDFILNNTFGLFSTATRFLRNSVVYEIISTLPLPAENSTLDSGADDLATQAANAAREKLKSTSDEDMWDPNTAFDRYVKVKKKLFFIKSIFMLVFL